MSHKVSWLKNFASVAEGENVGKFAWTVVG